MKIKRQLPQSGEVFEVPYPFVEAEYSHYDGDDYVSSVTWRPGTRSEMSGGPDGGDQLNFADGLGKQSLTVLGVYRPEPFPTRVFFTRQWTDPDGKTFGNRCCRVTTLGAFYALTSGYRHPFDMANAVAKTK